MRMCARSLELGVKCRGWDHGSGGDLRDANTLFVRYSHLMDEDRMGLCVFRPFRDGFEADTEGRKEE
jgi:hypothetical protein